MELNYKFSSAFRSIIQHNKLGGICNSALQPDFLDSLLGLLGWHFYIIMLVLGNPLKAANFGLRRI
jgi:hypothetical protein